MQVQNEQDFLNFHIFSLEMPASKRTFPHSYLWAEVLDADGFEAFREAGIFDPETAASFRRHILEMGGSEEPMELYRRFRGREPGLEPLLRKRGLA